jgi:hypothetical protein
MPSSVTRRLAALAVVGLLAVAGCRESGGEGEFFEVSGKLFIFNYRVATATYLVTLRPLAPMREGDVVVARFEDPAGGEPIVVSSRIWPKQEKVVLESPPLRCVRKGRPYRVAIRIEDAAGAVRQTIETTMTSTEDQEILPDRPLVVGPVYTPNPELAGHPDGKLDEPKPACPGA